MREITGKMAYQSPVQFLEMAQFIVDSTFQMEEEKESSDVLLPSKPIMMNQCNFIVICAAAIESHLNWYLLFDKKIDVDKKINDRYISISDKIKSAPIQDNTKGECKAIFRLRDQVMHSKYTPRDPTLQFPYNSEIMLLSFRTLVNVARELLDNCPATLGGKIEVSEYQAKMADAGSKIKLQYGNGGKINWVEAVNTHKVALPIISIFDVETSPST